MVESVFNLKLIDFGISKKLNVNTNYVICNSVFGTPKYLAPEIIKNKRFSYQSDIYAIGILLYEVLVGVAPFEDNDKYGLLKMHIKEKMIKPRLINNLVSKPIENIIKKAMAKNIKNRYKSIDELQKDFNLYFENKYNFFKLKNENSKK